MKAVQDLITREQDRGSVFVFPSEAAASHWRKEFLTLTSGKAVRNDRFLSWDSFKEDITLHNRTDRPVNSVHRRLFAADIIRENGSGTPIFSRLVPPEFSGQASAFTELIRRILPELNSLVKILDSSSSDLDPYLEIDFRDLLKYYTAFMKENSLFEPSWEQPELATPGKQYFIIYPELIEDFHELEFMLQNAGCRFLNNKDACIGGLRLFENSVVETDTVLNEISALLREGAGCADIAVTCADDETAALLTAKAELRGIPLNYRSGRPLAEYPTGRLPELLRACRSSNYSIEAMKNLLLFRAFVWKDPLPAARLVRFGIENRCLKNSSPGKTGDVWAARISAAGETELYDFYKKLKTRIDAFSSCSSFEQLSREFQIFTSTFLETEAGLWDEESELVFQRSREVLSSLRETEAGLRNIRIEDPLGLWIDLLKEKIYVRQPKGPGIVVYPYRVSALINPRVHFIIGLSHGTSGVVSSAFGFLTDQQRGYIGAEELNMTNDFLRLYAQSGADVRFSCSSETPSGVSLPPGMFIENGNICRVACDPSGEGCGVSFDDPVLTETLWWQALCSGTGEAGDLPGLCPVQLEGFKYACATYMQVKEFDASEQKYPAGSVLDDIAARFSDNSGSRMSSLRVSASALNLWTSCRFALLLSYAFEVSEDQYILQAEDPLTSGNVMHDILFDFFSRLKEEGKAFSGSRINEYREMIRQSAEKVFQRWEKSGNYFYGPAWEALRRRAVSDLLMLPGAEAEQYDGLMPLKLEDWMDFTLENEDIRAVGRTDRISGGDGGAVIVDYKKSWKNQGRPKFIAVDETGTLMPPEKGYQLPFYILLARAAGLEVAGTSYYGIAEGRHFPVSGPGGVLSDEDVEALCELTLRSIREMAASVRAGDFMTVRRCDGCGFRAVCRKRFNVGWSSR